MSNRRKSKMTFTKKWVNVILIVALVDIQLTYVLALLDKQIAETLAITIVTEIVAVSIGYFIKSYLGKKAEEETKLERERMGDNYED